MLEAAPQRAARLYRQCSAGPGRQGAVEGAAGRGRRGCSLGFPTQGLKPLCRFLDPDPHRVSFWAPAEAAAPAPRSLESQRPEPVVEFLNWHHLSLSLISQAPAAQEAAASQRCLRDPFEFSGASAVTSSTSLPPTSSLLQKQAAVISVSRVDPGGHGASRPHLASGLLSVSLLQSEALWACMPNAPREACCLRAPGSCVSSPPAQPCPPGR